MGQSLLFPPIYIAAGSMMVSGTNLDARIVTEWDQRVGGCGLREKVSSALLTAYISLGNQATRCLSILH